jgi:hypothetical protein
VLRAHWAFMRLAFLQPKPHNIMFILCNSKNYAKFFFSIYRNKVLLLNSMKMLSSAQTKKGEIRMINAHLLHLQGIQLFSCHSRT